MKYLLYIFLFISTIGYGQYGYQGASTQASLIKPQQLRKTVSPGSNMLYVIGTKPSLLTPSFLRIQDSSTIASYGVDQRLRITATGGTIGLTRNFGAADYVVLKDSSLSNEGLLSVQAGGAASSVVRSNTSTSPDITIAVAGISSIAESGNQITITSTEVDGSISNEGSLAVGAGTGSTSLITSNTSGSTSVTITAAGILTTAEAGNVITLTATEVDGLTTNEGSLTVGAGTASTSLISSNTSGSSDVTIEAGGINAVSESGNKITITATEVDGSITNEGALTVDAGTASTSIINTNTSTSADVTISVGGINTISESGNLITITATEVDGSTSNELQSYSHSGTTNYVNTLSGSGGSFTLNAAGINAISHSTGTVTITATEVDGSVSNEGSLTVAAGGATTSLIHSNTSTAADITISVAGILSTAESGNQITLTATEVGTVSSVSGTTDRISVTGGTGAAVVDIAATYAGQTSITSVGTLTVGTWNATDISFANIAQLGANTVATNATTGTADISSTALSASTLLGRGSSGNISAISVGGILSFAGTTLNATEVDGNIANEGLLTVGAGSGTTSTIASNTAGGTAVTIAVTGGLAISEGGSTITLSGSGLGTIKHIKAGTEVYQLGIDIDNNVAKDTFTVNLDYPTMTDVDSTQTIKADYIPMALIIDDVPNNVKLTKFNFLKPHERVISSSGTFNFDFDDVFGIVIFTSTGSTYMMDATPDDGDEISFVNTVSSSFPVINGNGNNIAAAPTIAATYTFSSQWQVLRLRYFASQSKWINIH